MDVMDAGSMLPRGVHDVETASAEDERARALAIVTLARLRKRLSS